MPRRRGGHLARFGRSTARGADLCYGRTPPRTLREAGLVDVAAAGSFPVGGAACDRLEIATMPQTRAELARRPAYRRSRDRRRRHGRHHRRLDLTLAPLISA
jgi:hypothetical protein